jgi:hypothetical protein
MQVWGGAETVPIARPNKQAIGTADGLKSSGGPSRGGWGLGGDQGRALSERMTRRWVRAVTKRSNA